MTSIENLVSGQPEGRKPREFAGFKLRLVFRSHDVTIDTEARYAKSEPEQVFSAEGVKKVGPNGHPIKYSRGEWRTVEVQPDGSEVEVSDDQIKYLQDVDGQQVEVSPFDATKEWEIREERNQEECTLDGPKSLGTCIPIEKIHELAPDKERGSMLYEVWGEGLRSLAEKLEREKLALYMPHVFRKGMTIHLAVAHIVRFNGKTYLIMRTFAGPMKLRKAVSESEAAKVEERKPILMKPVLMRKKLAGVA